MRIIIASILLLMFNPFSAYSKLQFWDDFTGANNTYLGDHPLTYCANTYTAWAPGNITAKIQSNAFYDYGIARSLTLTAGFAYPITITAQVNLAQNAYNHAAGIMFRYKNSSSFLWACLYSDGTDRWLAIKRDAGGGYGNDVTKCAANHFCTAGNFVGLSIIDTGYDVNILADATVNTPTTPRLYLSNTGNAQYQQFGFGSFLETAVSRADNFRLYDAEADAPTFTPTVTPTISPTPSVTPTKTITATITPTITITVTPVISTLQTSFGTNSDWQVFGASNFNASLDAGSKLIVTAGVDTYTAERAPHFNGRSRWYYIPSLNWTVYNLYVTLESIVANYGGTYISDATWGRGIIVRYKDPTDYMQVYFPPLETSGVIQVVGAPSADGTYGEIIANTNQQTITPHAGDNFFIQVADDGIDYDIYGVATSTATSPTVRIYLNDVLVGQGTVWYNQTPHRDFVRKGNWGIAGDSQNYQIVYTWSGINVEGVNNNVRKRIRKNNLFNSPWLW